MGDSMAAAQTSATDSFSQNWLQNTHAPFEFSYIRSDLEAVECDDQCSVGSFNFGNQLPHWFKVGDTDDVVYADELFFDGFIRAREFSPAEGEDSGSEREALCVVKHLDSAVSSPGAVLRCRFLGKWGKGAERFVIKCWKVFKCGLKSKNRKKKKSHESHSGWSSGRCGPSSYVENPIYEAVLHCRRSSAA